MQTPFKRAIRESPLRVCGGNIALPRRRISANAVQTGGVISASRNVPSPTGLWENVMSPRRLHCTKCLPPWGRWQPKADGEGFIVEYRKHIPSRRGDSRIARRMFADVLSTQRPKPPVSTVILSGAEGGVEGSPHRNSQQTVGEGTFRLAEITPPV